MSPSRSRVSEAVAALAHRDYRRFATSLLLTSLGVQLLETAILWQVYELTGSAIALGVTGVVRVVPHVVLSMVGGVVADRVNRVRLNQAGQLVNMLLVIGLAVLTFTGSVELWHLYAATFVNSASSAVVHPARTALIPRLVPMRDLVNAVGLNVTISQIAQIVGPAIAGVAVATVDLGPAYAINAALYLAAIVPLAGIRDSERAAMALGSPWQSFIEGMRFVSRRRVILSLLGMDLGAMIFGSYRALLPIVATSLGAGAAGFGLLSSAPGVGALLGVAVMLGLGDMRYKGIYAIAGVLGYCLSLLLLALSPWMALSLVAAGLLGATNAVQVVPRNTVILTLSPDAMRGRVEAFRMIFAGGGQPIGYTSSGALAQALGASAALAIGGIACIGLVAWIAMTDRELRERDLGDYVEEPVLVS